MVWSVGRTVADLPLECKCERGTGGVGGKFTLDAAVIGGTSPYAYSIKFNPPNIIPDVIDQQSAGPIHHEFTVPTNTGAKADQVITFRVQALACSRESQAKA